MKILSMSFLSAIFGMCMMANATFASGNDANMATSNNGVTPAVASGEAGYILPADMYLRGRIGGDENCELYLEMRTNRGHYNFLGMTRSAKVSSYNKATRQLIVKAYDARGTYIGQFVGKFKYENFVVYGIGRGSATYKGTFTNTKGGKVTFDLSDFWD